MGNVANKVHLNRSAKSEQPDASTFFLTAQQRDAIVDRNGRASGNNREDSPFYFLCNSRDRDVRVECVAARNRNDRDVLNNRKRGYIRCETAKLRVAPFKREREREKEKGKIIKSSARIRRGVRCPVCRKFDSNDRLPAAGCNSVHAPRPK